MDYLELESSVKNLVAKAKREVLSGLILNKQNEINPLRVLPPSAYDTAWLAMIPNPQHPDRPLFKGCLDWLLHNQKRAGFWGGNSTAPHDDQYHDHHDRDGRHYDYLINPTIDCLSSTLACIIALRTWNVGDTAIDKGLAFIHASAKKLLLEQNGSFPPWFAIVFPGMVELAKIEGLEIDFSNDSTLVKQHEYHPSLKTYIEALPKKNNNNSENEVSFHQSEDGSVFQSPAATAYAFMMTGNEIFLAYLEEVVKICGHGVPSFCALDEDLVKISVIDWIERLGLAEHFTEEIKTMLGQVFRGYTSTSEEPENKRLEPLQIHRDALAFRLLRLHGHRISPQKICWFLDNDDTVRQMDQKDHEAFLCDMYSLHRATDVTFAGESQLEAARALSTKILQNETTVGTSENNSVFAMPNLQDQIKDEIYHPWLARLDHLEHRKFIERNIQTHIGRLEGPKLATFYRLSSCLRNSTLQQLAIQNFMLRQSKFRNELKDLQRWSKRFGLTNMGFAREKTAYCYFAVAATVPLLPLSDVRLTLVKSACLVTVADDFFDAGGSLEELKRLTTAVQRWEPKDLSGHSKAIFNALENLVDEISHNFSDKNGNDIKTCLQDLWYQTFKIWLKEAEWSRNGYLPSIEEYLEVATSSIATQTIVLPASLLISPTLPLDILKFPKTEKITHLLMVLTRLLNDIRTFQREKEEGKPNLVLLYMKENPEMGIEDSISVIQKILEEKKKEFLELVLVRDKSDNMPEACKELHLSCLKAFQMFYGSSNAFDSTTELLADINKAIYEPLLMDTDQGPIPINSLGTVGLNNRSSKSNNCDKNIGYKNLEKHRVGSSSVQPCKTRTSQTVAKDFQRKLVHWSRQRTNFTALSSSIKLRSKLNAKVISLKPNACTNYPCLL
ncbi:S-linalool synthase [Trema orientale]|uniref:S-linalool synthase n=1 Tax=Trema orientale TaxID=63057 RepID=A0A2P5EGE8_TREOI|nr:S-linalool synthase [Trema orientale]